MPQLHEAVEGQADCRQFRQRNGKPDAVESEDRWEQEQESEGEHKGFQEGNQCGHLAVVYRGEETGGEDADAFKQIGKGEDREASFGNVDDCLFSLGEKRNDVSTEDEAIRNERIEAPSTTMQDEVTSSLILVKFLLPKLKLMTGEMPTLMPRWIEESRKYMYRRMDSAATPYSPA